jgi:hypothetical protein
MLTLCAAGDLVWDLPTQDVLIGTQDMATPERSAKQPRLSEESEGIWLSTQ